MLNVDALNDDVVSCLCNNMEIDSGEDSTHEKLAKLSFDEAWERYLTWNGIIGYGPQLSLAYENLKQAIVKK